MASSYGSWKSATAKITSTNYCYRRRQLTTRRVVGDAEQASKSLYVEHDGEDTGGTYKIPQLKTRSNQFQSFTSQAFEDIKEVNKKDDHHIDSSYDSDDSDDEEDSEDEAERSPSSLQAISYKTYYSTHNSNKIETNQKRISRRKRSLQQYPSVQRRAKTSHLVGGAAGGYYLGSHHNSHHGSNNYNRPEYSVTYAFVTNDGQSITATTDYCTSAAPPVGGTEMILYNPSNPYDVVSEGTYEKMNSYGLILTLIGVSAILLIGAFLYKFIQSMKGSSSNNTTTTYPTNNAYADNPHQAVDKPYGGNPYGGGEVEKPSYGAPPSYGEPPAAQAYPVYGGNSAGYKPP